ncbi:MAG: TrkA family potassium uptake protein [Leptospiraceae bacterium]|nr:TrkA family potassium uptake protein [Leptospiraceae bacterium]
MKKSRIAVIGLGEFGTILVRQLFDAGHEVVAIDRDMGRVEGAVSSSTDAVCLDSTDREAVAAQELEDFDAVIIALSDFEALISTANLLRELEVPHIMARYQSRLEYKILRMLGVTELFNPDDQAARSMVQQLTHQGALDRLIIHGPYRIAEVVVPESLIGQSLSDCGLRLKFNLNLVTLRRHNERSDSEAEEPPVLGVPYGDTKLEAGDIMILFGKQKDIQAFLEETG